MKLKEFLVGLDKDSIINLKLKKINSEDTMDIIEFKLKETGEELKLYFGHTEVINAKAVSENTYEIIVSQDQEACIMNF
ncbi:MAG: hypothetical protein ACRDD7_11085 [Peptostreptococcaceae bacterium]